MFKYVSDIIKSITPRQRVLALFITLLFILLITLGGQIITAVTNSDRILENKVNRLEDANRLLTEENKSIREELIGSQIQCGKDIVNVRQQIIDEISQIERSMMSVNSTRRLNKIEDDSVMAQPQPLRIVDNSAQIMGHLKVIKSRLQDENDNN